VFSINFVLVIDRINQIWTMQGISKYLNDWLRRKVSVVSPDSTMTHRVDNNNQVRK